MKLLIVDDESLALQRLERLLNEIGENTLTKASSASEALAFLETEEFDALITDINMPGLSGLDLAYAIRIMDPSMPIVFQTAYEEHALKSFDIGAVDYLLKPYTKELLSRALTRIEEKRGSDKKPPHLMAKNKGEYYLLEPKDIFYVQADLSEVILRTSEGFCYYGGKISQMELLLEPFDFVKVHRSYLININKIRKIEPSDQSKMHFLFEGIQEYVESSKDGAKLFRKRFPKSIEVD